MSPSEVSYISTTTIQPATYTADPTQQIHLTPWDLSLLPIPYIQKGLLFFKPKQQDQTHYSNHLIPHLKISFSQTLDHFYPFAGRLATKLHQDNTTSIYITCNSAGAEFIHATADITVSDFLNPIYVPSIVNSFFSLNGVMNFDGRTHPLISVQVTELIDGIFIGCCVNHAVCDGTSFWHFMNTWSEISRGTEPGPGGSSSHYEILKCPIFKRWFLKPTDSPIRLPFSLVNDERFKVKRVLVPLEQRVFHFSKENLASLKSKAKSYSNYNISTLQALLAHFWVAITKARRLGSNEETSYYLAMGNRSRLIPPLPESYFGNSMQLRNTTVKVGELIMKGIGFGSMLLNQLIQSHNEESIRNAWESWMEKPELMFRTNVALVSNNLVTGSSPRFNMYGNDFGWGRPIAVRSGGSSKRDGKLTVFAGAVEGSMDIEACLSPVTMEALGNDVEFMADVTITRV